MVQTALTPPEVMPSVYGPPVNRPRVADVPGMVSVAVTELFPDIKQAFLQKQGIGQSAKATKQALSDVDMSMIGKDDSLNILCSEHGFYILEGLHYREMLKTLGEEVIRRTGCENIRYRLATGVTLRESAEVIDYFDLEQELPGKITAMHPWDKALPIETEIGTLYGLAKAYDSDWIIHASHDEPRDLYFYRMMNRNMKAFAMSYARFETRAVYHGNFLGRSANFLQQAIFSSNLVQDKFTFACILRTSPAGVTGISAGNDLYELDRTITKDLLRDYGKMLRLFAEVEDCIAVLDAGRLMYYLHAGGICFGCIENAGYDAFDLSNPAATPGQDIMAKIAKGELDRIGEINSIHSSIKALVVNQAWPGLPISNIPAHVPTMVVGAEMADLLRKDAANPLFMEYSVTSDSLESALAFAKRIGRTDKVIAFDGSFGYITASSSMAEHLKSKADQVSRKVDQELLPMWLKQRSLA